MKRGILLLCAINFGFNIFGQFKKDNALLGAGAGYSQSKSNGQGAGSPDDSRTDLNMRGNARFGYFFRERFALGLLCGYTKTVAKTRTRAMTNLGEQIDNYTYTGKEYSIGIFTRFYKSITQNKLAFFCQLDASYITGTNEGKQKGSSGGKVTFSREPNGEVKGMTVGLHPGFVYFIGKRIGIEASFGTGAYDYRVRRTYLKGVKINENTSGGLNMNFGLTTFNLGLSFYLCEKRP